MPGPDPSSWGSRSCSALILPAVLRRTSFPIRMLKQIHGRSAARPSFSASQSGVCDRGPDEDAKSGDIAGNLFLSAVQWEAVCSRWDRHRMLQDAVWWVGIQRRYSFARDFGGIFLYILTCFYEINGIKWSSASLVGCLSTPKSTIQVI